MVNKAGRSWIAAAAASLLLCGAAEPARTDVFISGQDGYFMYRIPGLVVTPRGALLAYAEARRTSASDWDDIRLVMRRSEDGGATWTPQQIAGLLEERLEQNPAAGSLRRPPEMIAYNNPVAIADRKKGLVHLVYCVEYMRAFAMSSRDDGRTFSRPVEITSAFEGFRPQYNWRVIATGPGHGIQLRSGRLIVPVWLSTATVSPHSPSVVATIYSDDHGRTWRAGQIAIPEGGEVTNPNESVAVELSNGRVMLNVRSTSRRHRRVVVTSPDGATRWSAPVFQEELLEPICFGSIVRHGSLKRRGPNRLLFVNPDNLLRGGQTGAPGQSRDRRNLTVQLSEDDGATWKKKRVIDQGWAGYADIASGPDGWIYVLYERGALGEARFRIAALTLVKFRLSWILEQSP